MIKALGDWLFNDDVDSVFFDVIFFAVLAASIVAVLLVYFLENFISTVEHKHHIEIQLSRHEKEKVIAKYLSLRRQLNPHFLFNSFNGLISLISIDQRKAENFVEELSNIYRYNLSQADEVVVSLRKELKMIASYVGLQQIRFSGALIYHEEVEEAYKDFLVPPMSLQLLVENAIKHNRVEAKNPLVIKIFNDADYVVVQNNLQAKNKSHSRNDSFGIGTENLKNQLEVIQSRKPIFDIKNEHYLVKIPMIKNEIDD
ncbi:sensor histidine kinase [Maribacter sp. 2307UL18-2]|uniref:sensor histidine kinase n=1 Tax=Maribacter sp. 2307UL18-2 TaxID=3386274 RepID=UPI0039BCC5AA